MRRKIVATQKNKIKILKVALPEAQSKVLLNFKINRNELAEIQERAKKYYMGNTSAYIRHCCLNYKPREDELIEVEI